ncbi:MAG TPA: hypothetical protein VGI40_16805 [Pirellulaceae bacterium]|jgi:hypothetical protein
MPRTFTLARLFVYVTLLAAACGLVVNFPDAMQAIVIGGCFATPLVFIWLGLNARYRLEVIKFAASFLGAMGGMRLSIYVIQNSHFRLDYTAESLVGWVTIATIIVTCTFAPLGAVFVGDNLWRRYWSKAAGN